MRKKSLLPVFFFILINLSVSAFAEKTEKDLIFKEMAEKLSAVAEKLKKETVAVYGFEMIGRKDDSYSRYATEKLTHELVEAGRLLIIERSRIDKLLKEQQLSQAGIIDADEAAKIGKILSVDGVIIGSISVNDDEIEFIARVVQSETAIILKSVNLSYVIGAENKTASGNANTDTAGNKSSEKNGIYAGNPQIALSKKAISPGGGITINYSGLPGNKYDWITLVDGDKPDDRYGQWFYTQGNREGSYTFDGVGAGHYEVRVYYNWPEGKYIVRYRLKVIVE